MDARLTMTIDGVDSHGHALTKTRAFEVDLADPDRVKGLAALSLEHLLAESAAAVTNGAAPPPAPTRKPARKRAARKGR